MWYNTPASKGRFTPNDFKYNGRVAIALVPSLLVAAALGGKVVIGGLMVGAMITYILDSLQLRDGALLAAWSTLGLSEAVLVMKLTDEANNDSILLVIGIVSTMGTVFALAGVWTTLQFKWFQLQYPGVALAFERLILTSTIPVTAISLTIFLATVVHVSTVPYYLVVVLASLHYTLARPLPSSFHAVREGPSTGGKAPPPVFVQGRSDLLLSAFLLVVLPPSFYVAVHWYIMSHWVHVWSTLLLVSLPLLFLTFLDMADLDLFRSKALQQSVLVAALVAALVGFEGRVLFHAFAQYIKLQPPFNYIAVTVAILGVAALASAHFTGALGTSLDVTLAGTLLLLCTTAGGIAAGIPFHWLPAPLVASCGLAMYYDSRSLREYIAFVVGCLGTAFWFVYSHFWFLDVDVEGMSLKNMCKLVLAAMVPALLIPGVVTAGAPTHVVDVLLLFQAIGIGVLEQHLYGGHHVGQEVMYPAYLLVFTSMLGVLAAHKLLKASRISPLAAWLTQCMYVAKASMLLLPRSGLVLPFFLLLSAVSAPLMLYRPEPGKRRLRLHPGQSLLHVLAVVATVIHARFAIFDVVQYLFATRPTEALLLGSLVVVAAVGCAPLVTKAYAGVISAQRLLACAAATGSLLILLQPPLPIRGGAWCPRGLPLHLCPRLWDERHIPLHAAEDIAIWGEGLGAREHWPRWLLLAAVVVAVAGAAGSPGAGVAGPGARTIKVLAAGGVGLLLGWYLGLEIMVSQLLIQLLVGAGAVLSAVFIALLQLPSGLSPSWTPLLVGCWGAVFGATMLLQAIVPLPPLPARLRRLHPDHVLQVDAERHQMVYMTLLAVFAVESMLMSFALKLKMDTALKRLEQRPTESNGFGLGAGLDSGPKLPSMDFFCGIVPSHVLKRFGKMLHLDGGASAHLQRLSREGLAWVPSTGNVLALLTFLLGLLLLHNWEQESDGAIFMLAPILLLLNQDPVLLPGLTHQQRYLPPVAVVTAYLTYLTIGGIWEVVEMGDHPDVEGSSLIWWVARHVLLLLCVLPSHLLFIGFLWGQKQTHRGVPWLLAPLAALPLAFSGLESLQFLAGGGLLMAMAQTMYVRQVKQASMKVI